ncbi:hypothetical protein N0V82_005003 [Gnomoniopsis sp. IMI 355080]|nr:hypothetical protein N0V82_005003 [Gnomoniopsis sp. IMI 355080]
MALVAVLAYSEVGLGYTGGFTGQVATHIKFRVPADMTRPAALKRQISIGGEGGGITLPGGLTLGGGGNKGGANAAGASNSTAPAAAATKGAQGTQGQSTSLEDLINAATGGAKNQTGAAGAAAGGNKGQGAGQVAGEGAAAQPASQPASQPATEGAGQAVSAAPANEGATKAGEGAAAAPAGEGAAKAGEAEPKAVTESEQFSENAGITLGADGSAQNLGGNLGITKACILNERPS